MEYNMRDEVKLFMVFDILGDTVRSGPIMWQINRERLEDVKNHILDLLLIERFIRKFLPDVFDYNKVFDYIICHDLEEAITGDITKFEGVSDDEKERVNKLAIDYLVSRFNGVMNLEKILNDYENRVDIESKLVNMIDRVHSASTFMKYQTENNIDMDNPLISPELRNNPFVVEKINMGYDLADIFYEYHMKEVNISDLECLNYNISRGDADLIVDVISSFAQELYREKNNKTLLDVSKDFPKEAMIYNKKYK
jgi:5'-deoxynucleotidase YfbR-like HD superfamily hydrolase